MTPFYSDDWLTLYGGDCREVLASLPSDSVDCVVTSPPYWGLRDYGTAAWEGGDAECDHLGGKRLSDKTTIGRSKGKDRQTLPHAPSANVKTPFREMCGKCGATRIDSQLGLERTPEEYVANMVAVFQQVRRVLKSSGTCWLNLGDSYAGGNGLGRNDADRNFTGGGGNHAGSGNPGRQGMHERTTGLKPKNLVGIPWRVAFGLQADGWYLRSDIIWSKPNPMPESVTDRPTKSHEYLFLLTKSARYYFDADAVRETAVRPGDVQTFGGAKARDGEPIPADDPRYRNGKEQWGRTIISGENGRNIRSVWTIATRPYSGAHFAVFPPELPERCIKAGSPQAGLVLDPFGGSGTVGMVANRLSRRSILIDLNPEYLRQQMKRNAQTPLGLGI